MNDSPVSPRSQWIHAARRAVEARLRAAKASSDRLALLREFVRLSGGRLAIPESERDLSELGRGRLDRFGLAVTPDGEAFMMVAPDHLCGLDASLPLHLRLDEDSRTPGDPLTPDAFLLAYSAHKRFKSPFQKAAARAVVTMPAGGAMIASMPTGGGKSLLFQLLAMQARASDRHATIVVIVPTIALALDHQRTLRSYPGLEESQAMPGSGEQDRRISVRDAFRRGEVPILLMSPECALRFMHDDLLDAAKRPDVVDVLLPYRLAAFVVDEAHIVEQWGRKFRPQFQRLAGLVRELRSRSPGIKTLLLSATLPPSARGILIRDYLQGCEALELRAATPRFEFDLFARDYGSALDRNEALIDLVDVLPRPAIVYVTKIAAAESMHARLTTERGYRRVGLFTGRSTGAARQVLVDAWAADRIDLMVATSAFGMGVDKQDVRSVVHACLPESPSRFYQEIGRAGRDGHQAFSFCLWTRRPEARSDRDVAFGMATGSWLLTETAMLRWNAMLRDLRPEDVTMLPGTYARIMQVRLSSHHDGINHGENDYNENWNQSLVALLQRTGALRVLGGPDDEDNGCAAWKVEILDHDLLREAVPDSAPWRTYAAVRDQEQRDAVAELNILTGLLQEARADCLLAGVFASIDPDAMDVAPCGRCPSCRRRSIAPPSRTTTNDVDKRWPRLRLARPTRDPAGLHVLTYAASPRLEDWIGSMVGAGIEQFYVPSADAAEVAKRLAALAAPLGLVTEWSPEAGAPRLGFADLPTVFVPEAHLPPDVWLDFVQGCAVGSPSRPHYLVVREGLKARGRGLAQIASVHPARALDDFMIAGSQTGNGGAEAA